VQPGPLRRCGPCFPLFSRPPGRDAVGCPIPSELSLARLIIRRRSRVRTLCNENIIACSHETMASNLLV